MSKMKINYEEKPLTEEQKKILEQQCEIIEILKNKTDIDKTYYKTFENKLFLKEGTLLHGAGCVMEHDNFLTDEQLKSISEKGILAPELFGSAENFNETHYCADFFRVEKDQTQEEYIKNHWLINEENITQNAPERKYLPMNKHDYDRIGFVINTSDEGLQQLLKYDVYRDGNKEQEYMKNIVNYEALENDNRRSSKNPKSIRERLSAILCGIPANYIFGIIVSNDIKENKELLNKLHRLFKDCYIADINGEFIIEPHKEFAQYESNNIVEKNKKNEKYEIMPIDVNADAHNHTRGSDGRQTSFRAMLRAYNEGMNIISITDHDSVKGFRNFQEDLYSVMETIREDKSYDPSKIIEMFENMSILKGTELITSYNGVIVEVLGYNFDIEKMEQEISYLKTTVQQKPYEALYEGFNKIIDEKGLVFDKTIIDDAYQKIKTEGKGGVVGPFFNELFAHEENKKLLKYIDEKGEEKVADTLKLFINKHLYNKKSELFVDMSKTRPTFKDTIDAIHRAGGQAFLAHAGRYKDKMPVEDYIDDMIEEGLDGLEVYYPDHSYKFREFLLQKVKEHDIKASGGSDDHHSKKEGIQYETGRVALPSIPETKWIQETAQNGKDFLSESIEIQEVIKELRELKELRLQRLRESKEQNKKEQEKSLR